MGLLVLLAFLLLTGILALAGRVADTRDTDRSAWIAPFRAGRDPTSQLRHG